MQYLMHNSIYSWRLLQFAHMHSHQNENFHKSPGKFISSRKHKLRDHKTLEQVKNQLLVIWCKVLYMYAWKWYGKLRLLKCIFWHAYDLWLNFETRWIKLRLLPWNLLKIFAIGVKLGMNLQEISLEERYKLTALTMMPSEGSGSWLCPISSTNFSI